MDPEKQTSQGGRTLKIADTSGQDVQLAPPDPRRKWLILGGAGIIAIVLAILVAPSVQRWANASVSVPYDRVRTATVQRGDLISDVSVQGRVVAAVSPTLYATAPGTITLLVDAGEQVSAGQELASVDSPELAYQLQQEEATLAQRRLQLERQRIESRQQALESRKAADLAEVAVVAARREQRRAEQAREKGVIPEIDYEKAEDDLQNAELAFEHASADATLINERLSFELRASEYEVDAQELVGDLLVDQKDAVSRDMPVMAVVDLTRFEIDAMIPESYADDLAIGMNAEITIGGNQYDGQLVAVSPEVVNNQVASRIRFIGDGPTGLRQNQRLTTRILLAEHNDVLMVQRGQFLDTGGGRLAYVVSDDRVATRRQIRTGAYSLGAVEIVSGLEAGETIVISNLDPFRGAETVLLTD